MKPGIRWPVATALATTIALVLPVHAASVQSAAVASPSNAPPTTAAPADIRFAAWPGTPAPKDIDYPYPMTVAVDATNLGQRIFRVKQTLGVAPGPMTLLLPEWLPGNHSPRGTIDKLAGLRITANGQEVRWERDRFDVYAFKVEVPQGASSLDIAFDYLTPQGSDQGRVVMTQEMLNLQWNAVALYPAGYYASRIKVDASVTLPAGWSYAGALDEASRQGDTVRFRTIDFDDLVDSPLFAGKYFKRIELDPGAAVPVRLNVFADDAKSLEATPAQVDLHRELVRQAYKLYGAHHYDHYDFLLALTTKLGGVGLEHHRSSENSRPPGYFTEWDKTWSGRDLLAHEYNHSWDGKYRRGADLATPNFNVPMGDSLLWVYEGQTQFFGYVLSARSGLWTQEQARDVWAAAAATYDRGRPGQDWRTLQDTTNDPIIASRRGLPFRNYQMSEDYYVGGAMTWLAVDAKLRELTRGKRSIDDFAKAFFGMENGKWDVNPYMFEDVADTLQGIAPYDWTAFLRDRLDGKVPLLGGLEAQGWKLAYVDTPSEYVKANEASRDVVDMTYSLGATFGTADGKVGDVLWNGPAFKGGLSPSMTLVAVDGRAYKPEVLKDAVKGAVDTKVPMELLVKDMDRYTTVRVDYHGGLRYPKLERIPGKADTLGALFSKK